MRWKNTTKLSPPMDYKHSRVIHTNWMFFCKVSWICLFLIELDISLGFLQLLEPGRYIWLLKALYGLLMLLPQVCLVNLQLLLFLFPILTYNEASVTFSCYILIWRIWLSCIHCFFGHSKKIEFGHKILKILLLQYFDLVTSDFEYVDPGCLPGYNICTFKFQGLNGSRVQSWELAYWIVSNAMEWLLGQEPHTLRVGWAFHNWIDRRTCTLSFWPRWSKVSLHSCTLSSAPRGILRDQTFIEIKRDIQGQCQKQAQKHDNPHAQIQKGTLSNKKNHTRLIVTKKKKKKKKNPPQIALSHGWFKPNHIPKILLKLLDPTFACSLALGQSASLVGSMPNLRLNLNHLNLSSRCLPPHYKFNPSFLYPSIVQGILYL